MDQVPEIYRCYLTTKFKKGDIVTLKGDYMVIVKIVDVIPCRLDPHNYVGEDKYEIDVLYISNDLDSEHPWFRFIGVKELDTMSEARLATKLEKTLFIGV